MRPHFRRYLLSSSYIFRKSTRKYCAQNAADVIFLKIAYKNWNLKKNCVINFCFNSAVGERTANSNVWQSCTYKCMTSCHARVYMTKMSWMLKMCDKMSLVFSPIRLTKRVTFLSCIYALHDRMSCICACMTVTRLSFQCEQSSKM